jgi:nucleoside-diphosphate-sugar epimerase
MGTESVSAPVALVTGADKGIGLETAQRLAGAGYRVYLTARSSERGQAAAATVGARFLELNVTSDESVRHAAGCVEQAEGAPGRAGQQRRHHRSGARPARLHRRRIAEAVALLITARTFIAAHNSVYRFSGSSANLASTMEFQRLKHPPLPRHQRIRVIQPR